MGYTPEERKQIAEQIRIYAQQGTIHSIELQPEWMKNRRPGMDLVEVTRSATAADVQWLDMVARDVEGLIKHES